jgi:hypothetical protein
VQNVKIGATAYGAGSGTVSALSSRLFSGRIVGGEYEIKFWNKACVSILPQLGPIISFFEVVTRVDIQV